MNWPDPGASSPPPDDVEDGPGGPGAPAAGEDSPQPDGGDRTSRPDAGDPSGDAVWLSSDDLASSPRPWEDRDPSQLPTDGPATGGSDGDATADEPAFETPTYAQLRSEAADELGRWERPRDDPAEDRPDPSPDAPALDGGTEPAPGPGEAAAETAEATAERDVRPDETPVQGGGSPPAGTREDAFSGPNDGTEGLDPQDGDAAASGYAQDTPPGVPQEPVGGAADSPGSPPGGPSPTSPPEALTEPDAAPSVEPVVDGPPDPDPDPAAVEVPRGVGSADATTAESGGPPSSEAVEGVVPDSAGEDADAAAAFHGERPPEPPETFHGEHPPAPTTPPAEAAPFHGEHADAGEPTRNPTASVIEEALSGLETANRHATVICVANQKGGVGKTTTTVSLGAALAMAGAQVLVVDLDPQGNATTGLGLRAQEGAPSTYRVIVEQMDVEDAAEPTAVRGLHVLPSSLDLAGAEIELVPAFSRENRLKQALDAVRDLYDVILIDCPPSLGLLTINALVAADQVLVPIQCEYYALEGLGQLMRTVKLVADSLNRGLAVGGVVLTMFDGRTNLSQQVADEVRGYFGDIAYQTIVPRTVRLSEAPSYGQPIGVFDAASRGARAYQRLAREVARRLDLELEGEEVSPLDRLLGSATPATPDEAAPLPTDLAPEDVPGGADAPSPAEDGHDADLPRAHEPEPPGPHDDEQHAHGEDQGHGGPQGHEEQQGHDGPHGHAEHPRHPDHGGDHEQPHHHEDQHGPQHDDGHDQPAPGTEGQP